MYARCSTSSRHSVRMVAAIVADLGRKMQPRDREYGDNEESYLRVALFPSIFTSHLEKRLLHAQGEHTRTHVCARNNKLSKRINDSQVERVSTERPFPDPLISAGINQPPINVRRCESCAAIIYEMMKKAISACLGNEWMRAIRFARA